jgi:hypothetical protein
MSGIYNNWFKPQNPSLSNDIIQMESGGYQTPFYFGGSQVLESLNIQKDITGKGIYKKSYFKPEIQGKNVQKTTYEHKNNIHIPRNLKF